MLNPRTLAFAVALAAAATLGGCGAESAAGSEASETPAGETPSGAPVAAVQATWIVYTVPG